MSDNFIFKPEINKSLEELFKIKEFTEIQKLSFDPILEGKNLIALAETGSGKTLAYLAPLLSNLIGLPKKPLTTLIVTPTKELADQILKTAKKCSQYTNLISDSIYGGKSFSEQELELKKGKHLIVACPGRLVDHIEKKTIDLSNINSIVLDEADQLFDLGFLPHLEIILNAIPKEAQKLLFSATMSQEIASLSTKYISSPVQIEIKANMPKEIISAFHCPISEELKYPFLRFLLKHFKMKSVIIFCNKKETAKNLFDFFLQDKYKVALIEGDMTTHQRKKSLDSFREKTNHILIATDVAARGLDIPHVQFIINLEPPLYTDSYIHRMGRSARHDQKGSVFTLYNPQNDEKNRLIEIIKTLNQELKPHKFSEFNYSLKIDNKNRRII